METDFSLASAQLMKAIFQISLRKNSAIRRHLTLYVLMNKMQILYFEWYIDVYMLSLLLPHLSFYYNIKNMQLHEPQCFLPSLIILIGEV